MSPAGEAILAAGAYQRAAAALLTASAALDELEPELAARLARDAEELYARAQEALAAL